MMRWVQYALLVLFIQGCGSARHKPRPKLPARIFASNRPRLDCRAVDRVGYGTPVTLWECPAPPSQKEEKK